MSLISLFNANIKYLILVFEFWKLSLVIILLN